MDRFDSARVTADQPAEWNISLDGLPESSPPMGWRAAPPGAPEEVVWGAERREEERARYLEWRSGRTLASPYPFTGWYLVSVVATAQGALLSTVALFSNTTGRPCVHDALAIVCFWRDACGALQQWAFRPVPLADLSDFQRRDAFSATIARWPTHNPPALPLVYLHRVVREQYAENRLFARLVDASCVSTPYPLRSLRRAAVSLDTRPRYAVVEAFTTEEPVGVPVAWFVLYENQDGAQVDCECLLRRRADGAWPSFAPSFGAEHRPAPCGPLVGLMGATVRRTAQRGWEPAAHDGTHVVEHTDTAFVWLRRRDNGEVRVVPLESEGPPVELPLGWTICPPTPWGGVADSETTPEMA